MHIYLAHHFHAPALDIDKDDDPQPISMAGVYFDVPTALAALREQVTDRLKFDRKMEGLNDETFTGTELNYTDTNCDDVCRIIKLNTDRRISARSVIS